MNTKHRLNTSLLFSFQQLFFMFWVQLIFFERVASRVVDLAALDPNEGMIIQGAYEGDNCGLAVTLDGDVNGDGYHDMIIGCYHASPLARSLAGSGYIIFGENKPWPAIFDLMNFTSDGVFLIGHGGNAQDYTDTQCRV